MSALRWLLIYGTLVTLVISIHAQACSDAGRFGPQCAYACHCSVQCDRNSGQCPGSCVQPWSGPSCQRENVAYRKTAHTSGVYSKADWGGDRAVDGNRNQDVLQNSCFHSNELDASGTGARALEAWLYVDLGRPYHTRHITVFGRGEEFSLARLNNTRLFVSNTPNDRDNPCYTFTGQSSRGLNIVDLICEREGRFLTLYDNHIPANDTTPSAYMEICELEVYECSNGSYGDSCDKLCHCSHGLACDDVTGRCPDGCIPGFQGESCSLPCPSGKFGDSCSQTCHCLTGSCDVITGQCQGGCLPGWRGVTCSLPCTSGRFGADCAGECHCQDVSCDHVTGDGCQGRCAAGFLGKTCSSRCQETQFGENCASTCHCSLPGCDAINGSCHVPGCLEGYHGDHCNTDVDECTETGYVCEGNTVCVNTPGSFLCVPVQESAGYSQTEMAAVGGGLGGAAVLLLLATGVLYCLRRQRRPVRESEYSRPDRPEVEMANIYSTLDGEAPAKNDLKGASSSP